MILQIFVLAFITCSNVNSQALNRGDTRHKYSREPAGYVVPDSGYVGLYEQQEGQTEEIGQIQQYKPTRRAERGPTPTYQLSPQNDNNPYYQTQTRPQPIQQQSILRQIPQDYYQLSQQIAQQQHSSTPSEVNYEQIVKNNQIARLQLANRKGVPTVEQYLKEVTPTTKTNYQKPTNYLRFNNPAPIVKQEQIDETQQPKQQFQYTLPVESPQSEKSFVNYQDDSSNVEQPKPVQYKPHFNLVAYQNALLQQQKLLETQENSTPKSAIYVAQNVAKKSSNKIPIKTKQQPQQIPHRIIGEHRFIAPQIDFQSQLELEHEKLQQIQTQLFGQHPQSSTIPIKYQQQPIAKPKDQYHQQSDDLVQYQEQQQPQQQQQKELQSQISYKPTKIRIQQNKPIRPVKYYSEEQQDEQQVYEYQTTPNYIKYQNEETEQYQKPLVKRPTKYYEPKIKYQPPPIRNQEISDVKYQHQSTISDDSYLQNPQETVRQALIKRLPQQYRGGEEGAALTRHTLPSNVRYQTIRQYPEESQQFSEYRHTDLPYQTESSERYRTIDESAYRTHFQQSPNNKYYRTLRRPASYSFIE